jgi:hypothetical protein
MARFDSPIGGRNIEGNNFKSFEVDDPSMEQEQDSNTMSDLELRKLQQRAHQQKQERLNSVDRLSAGAKQRIEYLCGISTLSRDVTINNIKFVLQSLKNKEYKNALKEVAKVAGTIEEPFEMVKQMLCRSIVSIDGVSFSDFVSSDNLEDKKNFIEELGMAFCNRLYSEYTLLNDEINKKFAIDTQDKIEELVNDLKK